MTKDNFIEIVLILIIAIIVVGILGTLLSSRFTRTIFRDEFRSKNEIGKQNLGQVRKEKTYREIAKHRQLDEARLMEAKLNPKVTHAVASAAEDVRKKDD